jgi:hypothetical protein
MGGTRVPPGNTRDTKGDWGDTKGDWGDTNLCVQTGFEHVLNK